MAENCSSRTAEFGDSEYLFNFEELLRRMRAMESELQGKSDGKVEKLILELRADALVLILDDESLRLGVRVFL